MAAERDDDWTNVELGNGDTLDERIERLDLAVDETCSADALRHRLDL